MKFNSPRLLFVFLAFAGGCSAFTNPPKPPIPIEDFLVDNTAYPTEADAYWKIASTARIDASQTDVYEEIVNPVNGITDELPAGFSLLVDHSRSNAGPDTWGKGSVAKFSFGKFTGYIVVEECEEPNTIVHRMLFTRDEKKFRTRVHCKLSPAGENKTLVEMTTFGSPNFKTHFAWLDNWKHEFFSKRGVNILIDKFGGEIISVDAETNKDAAIPE